MFEHDMIHTIERVEKHYFTHRVHPHSAESPSRGYLYAVKGWSDAPMKLVDVTEVPDNRHTPHAMGPVSPSTVGYSLADIEVSAEPAPQLESLANTILGNSVPNHGSNRCGT